MEVAKIRRYIVPYRLNMAENRIVYDMSNDFYKSYFMAKTLLNLQKNKENTPQKEGD